MKSGQRIADTATPEREKHAKKHNDACKTSNYKGLETWDDRYILGIPHPTHVHYTGIRPVETMLRFSIRPDKVVNVMAFFAEKCPNITKMKMFKLMYFADKEHLLRYGRPITGDRYVAMRWGPTPSSSYDMAKAPSRQMSLFQSKLTVHGNSIKNLHSPDRKVFSRSDEKVLNEICEKYGKMTAAKLSTLSHSESSWKNTPENKIINFELMFQGRPDARLTLELLKQESSQPVHALETA